MAFVIAIDGPSASGKGTLCTRLSEYFGWPRLDTGLLYRAVGAKILTQSLMLPPLEDILVHARSLSLEDLSQPLLRSETVGQMASKIAAVPQVREILFNFQRDFSQHPPQEAKGCILDGRDIGTVICPEANAKIYITASLETRANRRFDELVSLKQTVSFEGILHELTERDRRDSQRKVSPLKIAPDALLIDSTHLTPQSVFERALQFISSKNPPLNKS